jgi:outer membrane lipoprotein LolB
VRLSACLALAIVAGCAQVELKPPAEVEFDVLGRIAARYAHEGFTGNVSWRHARGGDEMLISTPLGQGVARIVREGDAVQLTTSDQREYRAADAESLTERVLGFRLPLEGLADWIQARPSPDGQYKVVRSTDGKLQALEQRGWRIEYQEYDGARPARMRLTYQGIELRLAISEWR